MNARCEVHRLGLVEYRRAWELQDALAAEIARGVRPPALLLLQHPHTYSFGRRGKPEHLLWDAARLAQEGVQVVWSDRGGDVTYHGPGQLVGYPLLPLGALYAGAAAGSQPEGETRRPEVAAGFSAVGATSDFGAVNCLGAPPGPNLAPHNQQQTAPGRTPGETPGRTPGGTPGETPVKAPGETPPEPSAGQTLIPKADYVGYLRRLEETIILALMRLGVASGQIPGLSGVWLQPDAASRCTHCRPELRRAPAKIAAVGVKVDVHGVTRHGFAVNVAPEMRFWDGIIACGLQGHAVASLADLMDPPPDVDTVAALVSAAFGEVFGYEMVDVDTSR